MGYYIMLDIYVNWDIIIHANEYISTILSTSCVLKGFLSQMGSWPGTY